MANENSGPGFGTGLVLGGIIGALAGLIMGPPREGEDTLAQFKEKTEGLRVRAEELAAEARERLRVVVEEGSKAVAARMKATPGADSAEDTSPDGGG